VTCGLNGELLYVTSNGDVMARTGIDYANQHGTGWVVAFDYKKKAYKSGNVIDVSAGEDGYVWLLFANGKTKVIWRKNKNNANEKYFVGTTSENVVFDEDVNLITQIDAGKREVWAVNNHHEVYRRATSDADVAGKKWK
jgi:hypothetical protein